ncbi:MAG: hypothetical protein ACYDCP_07460 [Thermoplasmataceae archaeon]
METRKPPSESSTTITLSTDTNLNGKSVSLPVDGLILSRDLIMDVS